jgi:hypothetical protein
LVSELPRVTKEYAGPPFVDELAAHRKQNYDRQRQKRRERTHCMRDRT